MTDIAQRLKSSADEHRGDMSFRHRAEMREGAAEIERLTAEIERLRAAVEESREAVKRSIDRLCAASQWKPIATAPKDEIILLTDGKVVHPGSYCKHGGCTWHFFDTPFFTAEMDRDDKQRVLTEANGWLDKYYQPEGSELKWQPLPSPPTQEGGE